MFARALFSAMHCTTDEVAIRTSLELRNAIGAPEQLVESVFGGPCICCEERFEHRGHLRAHELLKILTVVALLKPPPSSGVLALRGVVAEHGRHQPRGAAAALA
jgi:hypothetical protein